MALKVISQPCSPPPGSRGPWSCPDSTWALTSQPPHIPPLTPIIPPTRPPPGGHQSPAHWDFCPSSSLPKLHGHRCFPQMSCRAGAWAPAAPSASHLHPASHSLLREASADVPTVAGAPMLPLPITLHSPCFTSADGRC